MSIYDMFFYSLQNYLTNTFSLGIAGNLIGASMIIKAGKEGLKLKSNNPKMIDHYKLTSGFHYGFLGMKRTGKTHNVKIACSKAKEGVFFFNVQHEKLPKNFITVRPKDDLNIITQLLKQNKKINFLPSLDDEQANKEFKAIVDYLFNVKGIEIFLVADEGSMYDRIGNKTLEKLATRGQTFGINLIMIAQRGTMIPNNVMKQLDVLVFHDSPFEYDYYKPYHIPIEEILKKINEKPYYMKWKDSNYNRSFVVYSRNTISEAFAIK